MARQGRAVRNYVDRETRGWQCIAAIVKLQAQGKRATAHSIAKELGMRPSTHLRNILHELWITLPGVHFIQRGMPNGVTCREFYMDTDQLYQYSLELFDTLATYVPLQYPIFSRLDFNDIPF